MSGLSKAKTPEIFSTNACGRQHGFWCQRRAQTHKCFEKMPEARSMDVGVEVVDFGVKLQHRPTSAFNKCPRQAAGSRQFDPHEDQ